MTMTTSRNAVEGCPGWYLGLIAVETDGSLLGVRRATVYGPNDEQLEVTSTEGHPGIQRAAASAIAATFAP